VAEHVCPWWLGYFLASPVRRLFENPDKILSEYIRPGMTVLDAGCAMGFFTLPAARFVGPQGRVIAVDLQQRMLDSLRRRAVRAGLLDRIEIHKCGETNLRISDLAGQVDFAMAIHMVHEVPDASALLSQLHQAVKKGGRLLIVEPKGHVNADAFAATKAAAQQAGFAVVEHPLFKRRWAALFEKA